MISRLVTKGVVIGVAATFAIAAPASAAVTPTLSGPEQVEGFVQADLTGTAEPNSTVELWESAYGHKDLKPAEDWEGSGGTVKVKVDSSGKFALKRWIDSGFLFEVHQGSVKSPTITVFAKLKVSFWMEADTATNGKLTVEGEALPAQPGLPVKIQRKNKDGSYTTVKTTETAGDTAAFKEVLTGQPAGDQIYHADFSGSTADGVRGTKSPDVQVYVYGTPTTTPTTPTTTPTTKPPTTPTTPPTSKPPTTPPTTTKPPTTPPTTKPPVATAPIQFTRIQYDPPGTDSGSNGSLNNEYFKITNMTKKAININGWTVRDGKGITYKFPNINMNVGQSYLVRTGKGTNAGSIRFWGRAGKSGFVWDNLGDIAYLRNPAGGNVDTCKWTKLGAGYTNC